MEGGGGSSLFCEEFCGMTRLVASCSGIWFQVADTFEKVELLRRIVSIPALQPVLYIVKKIFSSFLLSFALVGFSLLRWSKWSSVSNFLDIL